MEKQELKPFHESIVDAINYAFVGDLGCLSVLIKTTKIPKNHDAIIDAWAKRTKLISRNNDYGVTQSVLKQKSDVLEQRMNSAGNLEEALELGFQLLPLGSKIIGPQGKILLWRNQVPKETMGAEISIVKIEADGQEVL